MCLYIVRFIGFILARLPLPIQVILGNAAGRVLFYALKTRRKIARHNLEKAFPEYTAQQLDELTIAHFRHLGQCLVELLVFPSLVDPGRRDRKMVFKNFHILEKAVERNTAIQLLTGHHGNWEVMTIIALMGYKLTVIYKTQHWLFDSIINHLRSIFGFTLLPYHGGLKSWLKAVKDGKMIGILADQGGTDEFSFFGHPTRFPIGAAAFSIRYGLETFPIFAIRDKSGRIVVSIRDKLEVTSGQDKDKSEREFVRRYIEILENEIRKAPEQYYWVHDVWKDFKHRRKKAKD